MRLSFILLGLFAVVISAPHALVAQDTIPRFTSVDPLTAKGGDVITIAGENIGKDLVAEVYLTDGKNDFKVVVDSQTATEIKCKVPLKVPPAKYRLMVLTKGKEPKLIEQPVRLEVEEGS